MSMKTVLCLLLCLVLGAGCAAAETVDRGAYVDAVIEILDWAERLNDGVEPLAEADADAVYLASVMIDTMDIAASVLLDAADASGDMSGMLGEVQCQAPETYTLDGVHTVFSGSREMEEISLVYEVTARWGDAFMVISMTLYDTGGELLGMQRLEIGEKDEALAVLLVDYDHLTEMTGRFAMKPDGEQGNVIFTKTLGQTMDVVLNVKDWAMGTAELGEWEKSLLLPAAVLYQ